MAEINWGLARTPDFVGNALTAYAAGDQARTKRKAQNALAMYASDPEGAVNALTMVDPAKAASLQELSDSRRKARARDTAAPLVSQGNYTGAAKAVAASDPTFAKSLLDLDKSALEHTQRVGEVGASVLMSTLSLPSDQRKAFALSHADEIKATGIPANLIEGFDWGNDQLIKATATKFIGINKLAGEVSAQRFGDDVYSVETGPGGARVGPKPLLKVPASRAERLATTRADQDRSDSDRRYALDRERLDVTRESANELSFGNVVGKIAQKLADGAELTPGEGEVWKTYQTQKQDPFMASLSEGQPSAPAAQPSTPRPPGPRQQPPMKSGDAGTRANPHRPRSPADAANLPKGSFFVDPTGTLRQRQ